jgi:hypothetical protein
VPLVQDAVYIETDARGDQAMVEMKSGGITNHIKAVKEGGQSRAGYVESALQDLGRITPASQPMLKQRSGKKASESAPGITMPENKKYE